MTDEKRLTSSSFQVHALFLGERLDPRQIAGRLAAHPLVVEVGDRGWAALFRYGAVVFFDVPAPARDQFLDSLRSVVTEPYTDPEREDLRIRIDSALAEGVDDAGEIILHDADVERLQVVADILAKSVVVAQYEKDLAEVFNSVEPLAADLVRGNGLRRVRDLLKQIGGTLLIQHKMVGRVEVPEKPDLLWERPDLERLYLRLENEYELVERHTALERKLALINTTATTALEMVRDRRSLRVEWYIVLLIVVEIALTLYQMVASV